MSRSSDNHATLADFSSFMHELLRKGIHRANFRPWEIAMLLDIESCALRGQAKRKALLDYQHAVRRELAAGVQPPTPFSEFLMRREPSAVQGKAEKRELLASLRATAGTK